MAVLGEPQPPEHGEASDALAMFDPIATSEELVHVILLGLRYGYCGELRLVSEDAEAHVVLYCGDLAWVHCSTHREHFGDVLARDASVSAEAFAEVMNHSRRQGVPLATTLIDGGFVTRSELRSCIRSHVSTHLRHALAMRGPMMGRFEFDEDHLYDGSLVLSWSEAVEAAGLWR